MNMFSEGIRAAQKQATQAAVIAAAREEFEAVGYEAASIRAIARRAGVSAGTVIHYGADKRDLLHAALFADLEATLGQALGELGRGGLEARLARLTRGVFGYYEKRPKLSRTLLKESLFADEPWASRFNAQVARVHAEVVRLASEAGERGELREDGGGAMLSVSYLAFFYFALIAWVQGGHADPVALVDRLVAQHLAGLRPQGGVRDSKARRDSRDGRRRRSERNERKERKETRRKP
jgi:AcrR family transcriptional regulator